MKGKTIIILLILFVVVLMARDPARTTAEITTGEQALIGGAGAALGGIFPPAPATPTPTHRKRRKG